MARTREAVAVTLRCSFCEVELVESETIRGEANVRICFTCVFKAVKIVKQKLEEVHVPPPIMLMNWGKS